MVSLAIVPGTAPLAAQGPDTASIGAKRSMVTRSELQAALDEIQRGLTSSAYSSSLRSAKRKEADAIRSA